MLIEIFLEQEQCNKQFDFNVQDLGNGMFWSDDIPCVMDDAAIYI